MAVSIIGGNIEKKIDGVSIVAVGAFNPAIFQPLWFSNNNLIRDEEAKDAENVIVHKDVTSFSTSWFLLQVMAQQFSIATSDPTKGLPIRDLALGTFRILEHTPIEAFGFNNNRHFQMPSEDEWHSFGHHYAPKESWKGILVSPGMRALTMEGKRENCDAKMIHVKIEPSIRVTPCGVYIQVNEHYDFNEQLPPKDRNEKFLETLQNSWDAFITYCDRVSEELFTKYKN